MMITINTVCFRPDLAPFTSHIGDTFVLVFLFWFMTEGKMNSSSSVNLSKFGLLFTATFIIPGFLKSLVNGRPSTGGKQRVGEEEKEDKTMRSTHTSCPLMTVQALQSSRSSSGCYSPPTTASTLSSSSSSSSRCCLSV